MANIVTLKAAAGCVEGEAPVCPGPLTKAELLALRNGGQLNVDCHYIVTDWSQGAALPGPNLVELHAVDTNTLSTRAEVVTVGHSATQSAWQGTYDIDAAAGTEMLRLVDLLGNDISGAVNVGAFRWHDPLFRRWTVDAGASFTGLTAGTVIYSNVRLLGDASTLNVAGKTGGNVTNVAVESNADVTLSTSGAISDFTATESSQVTFGGAAVVARSTAALNATVNVSSGTWVDTGWTQNTFTVASGLSNVNVNKLKTGASSFVSVTASNFTITGLEMHAASVSHAGGTMVLAGALRQGAQVITLVGFLGTISLTGNYTQFGGLMRGQGTAAGSITHANSTFRNVTVDLLSGSTGSYASNAANLGGGISTVSGARRVNIGSIGGGGIINLTSSGIGTGILMFTNSFLSGALTISDASSSTISTIINALRVQTHTIALGGNSSGTIINDVVALGGQIVCNAPGLVVSGNTVIEASGSILHDSGTMTVATCSVSVPNATTFAVRTLAGFTGTANINETRCNGQMDFGGSGSVIITNSDGPGAANGVWTFNHTSSNVMTVDGVTGGRITATQTAGAVVLQFIDMNADGFLTFSGAANVTVRHMYGSGSFAHSGTRPFSSIERLINDGTISLSGAGTDLVTFDRGSIDSGSILSVSALGAFPVDITRPSLRAQGSISVIVGTALVRVLDADVSGGTLIFNNVGTWTRPTYRGGGFTVNGTGGTDLHRVPYNATPTLI